MKSRYIIIIIAIIGVCLATGLLFYKYGFHNNNYVLSVNDERVGTGEFRFILDGVKERMSVKYGISDFNNYVGSKKALELAKERASESVVSYTIESQKAKEKGIALSESEITFIQDKVDLIFSQNSKDLELITKAGLSKEGFKRLYIKLTTANKLKNQILNEISSNITISDQEAKTYFDKNKEQYSYEQEMVRAKHILIKTVDDNNNPLSPDKQDGAKKKAEGLLARAKAGEDFATLAKQYSQDEGSKDNGGEYIFPRDQMVKEFEDTAFSLRPGEISHIVKTEFGYHIIKLEEKYQKGQIMNYDTIKEEVKINAQYSKIIEDWKKQSTIIRNDKIYNQI